jgi:hypothetical protein
VSEVRKREGSALANAIYGEDIEKELRFACNQFDYSSAARVASYSAVAGGQSQLVRIFLS